MTETSQGKGRHAQSPAQIPTPGWKQILLRVWQEKNDDNIGIVAAGVAFYFLLAIFPASNAFITLYGLMNDAESARREIGSLAGMMPSEARDLLLAQFSEIDAKSTATLGSAAVISVILAIWSSMKGTNALVVALNIVYDETENRSFIYRKLLTFGMTLGAFLFLALALTLIAGLPVYLKSLGLGEWIEMLFSFLRWPLLAGLFMVIMAVLYRYAPSREEPEWRWVTPGSVVATVLWILGSLLFSWYVSNFASYNETFGSLGGVVVLLMWFYLTAFIICLSGELNAEAEHQTRKDSTDDGEQPIGTRGAYVADHVAEESDGR